MKSYVGIYLSYLLPLLLVKVAGRDQELLYFSLYLTYITG